MTWNLTTGAAGPSGPAGTGGASAGSTPADPSGTSDVTGKMMGLAGTITPAATGTILFLISGSISNDTITKTATVKMRTGTGSAPANGDGLTGTARGATETTDTIGGAAHIETFTLIALATSLVAGTPYWIDVGLAASGGGTATITGVSIAAIEL